MNRKIQSSFAGALALLGIAASAPPALAQQRTEISLSRQPGIYYMPTHIIEKQKLIEKHAALLGLPNISTKWITFSGGGAQTDALLAGGVDILNTGTGNLLLLWDRTRGGVKGIVACSAQPVDMTAAAAHQIPKCLIAGRGIEFPVEVIIGRHELLEVSGLGEFLLKRNGVVQLADQRLGVFERQRLDDFELQRLTQEMRLLRQADVDPADDGGVLREDLDQSLFLEAHQRITDRRRADAELAGQCGA